MDDLGIRVLPSPPIAVFPFPAKGEREAQAALVCSGQPRLSERRARGDTGERLGS